MSDIQTYQQEIIQYESGEQKSPQEIFNDTIEKQKIIIIQGMKKSLLIAGVSQEKINNLQFNIVGNIGIAINKEGKSNFYKYSKENGVEYYTNPNGLEKNEDLPFGERTSGYELNNGELFKNGQKITQFLENGNVNPDFVKGVDSINFYTDLQLVFGLMKGIIDGDKIRFSIKGMNSTIVSGVMRIKDIVYFAGNRDKISVDEKGTKLTDEDIKRLLQRAILELPNQCSDTRFYQTAQGVRMGMEVTKEELDEYLKPTEGAPLITQSLYDECLRRIEVRDKKIAEMNSVKENSKVERKIENERIGVLERVKGILGDLF